MNQRDLIDLVALCACGGKSIRQTISAIREVNSLEKHAATGAATGYKFRGLNFDCINPHHFALLFTEIFIAEPYRFNSSRPDTLVIDGGVNIGLSIAYFKRRFPSSRIVGFEPHPQAYETASRNIGRNKFTNVRLVNAAMTGSGSHVELNFIPDEIMASTIGNRLSVRGSTPRSVTVPAVQLSQLLREEVDFLKLDIEGAETAVLEEAGAKLRMVRSMFVEFHVTRNDKSNDLSRFIRILEDQGFDYLITSTLGNRRGAAVAPLKACGPVTSLSIHASRIE